MKTFKKFLIYICIVMTIVIALFIGLKYTANAELSQSDINDMLSEDGLKEYGMVIKITKPFSPKNPSYDRINVFPIDRWVFNSSPDFFCSQHGTPYGNSSRETALCPTYHTSYGITYNRVWEGDSPLSSEIGKWNPNYYYSTDPKGDVPEADDIPYPAKAWLDNSGNYKTDSSFNTSSQYWSYREYNEGAAVGTVYTNWVYNLANTAFGCGSETVGAETTEITGRGLAFLMACYKQTYAERQSTGYNNDPLQFAVWDWLGQLGSKPNPLKAAALEYQDYHEKSREPNVDTVPATNVGTTINSAGTTYTVGPFTMSNYVRAQDFSYSEVGSYNETVYEGTTDEEIYNMNVNNTGVNLQAKFDECGNYKGTIIKTEAVVTNEAGDEKRINLNMVPNPNQTYSINLSAASIEGYDELLDIIFTYQRVHANGKGTYYYGHQEALIFTEKSGTAVNSGCTYYCQDQTPSYARHSTSTYGRWQWCTYYWDCDDHYEGHNCAGGHYSSSCHNCTCSGHLDCSSSHHTDSCYNASGTKICGYSSHGHNYYCYDYCYCSGHTRSGCHCSCPGHSDSHWSFFRCGHGHEECKLFMWNMMPTHGGDYAQDGLAAAGELSTEQIEYKIRVSVPMKTNMSIYKYITKTEHVGESIVTYNGTERRERPMSEKYNDSLKVEKGDKITYKVEIVNDSRFPTRVKVKDTLPEPCSDEEIPDEILTQKWITVEPHSKNEYTITLRTNASTGKHTNIIEFITKNDTNPTMQCTEWENGARHGAHYNGAIVNIGTREIDGDTFEIKEYNVSMQKYIYDVSHNPENIAISSIDTTMGPSAGRRRGSMDEAQKQAAPVYVEYGDIVTYRIIVYNTTDNVDDEFDIPDRKAAPYWEPEKVYVNIEDELPQKYRFISIDATGATGLGSSAHYATITSFESDSGGTLRVYDLMVPAGGYRVLEVKLQVMEYVKGTIEENTAELVGGIKNINRGPHSGATTASKYCVVQNNSTNLISKDYYKLNDYNISLDKYLYKYNESELVINNSNGFTNESSATGGDNVILPAADRTGTEDYTREIETEAYKQAHPVNVEKGERITYVIKAKNNATSSGGGTSKKHATQVRTTKVTDYMQQGLKLISVSAKMYVSKDNPVTRYTSDGSVPVGCSFEGTASVEGKTCNKYEFTIDDSTILNPGEYIEYTVEVEVEESNMYLYSLLNKGELTTLTNINHVDDNEDSTFIVKDITHNENIASQQESADYVRMKDLVISGQVWLDINRNGLMDDAARSELEQINNNINANAMKKDVIVNLYQVGIAKPIRVTKTDANGLYTFGRDSGFSYYSTFNHTVQYNSDTMYQRIDKANNKDLNGNYTGSSQYLQYYVEFEYDGVLYKSTEIYAGKDNLNDDGSYNGPYLIDSNARELDSERREFNKTYEHISYNVAYDVNKGTIANGTLDFHKDGNASYLMENNARKITAKSFVQKTSDVIDYLWLFPFPGANYTKPETDYLKHIHLGLELREDVDLELSKDVYKVKTTINGEEMEYNYNLGYTADYLNDYIIKKPYGFEIYEADYKYRVDQYFADAVRNYKGINGEDELNVEVTYRINLKNKATTDDDEVAGATDTKLYVRVHEVLDLYDENFMKLTFNGGIATKENNEITVKQKGADGFLVDKKVTIGEAWMFMEESAVPAGLTKSAEKYVITNPTGGEKPNYREDESGTIVKAYLTIADFSSRGTEPYSEKANGNDFTEDGYNTAYIRGMENIVLQEGEDLDLYVKYVVDKDNLLTTIKNEKFSTEVDQNVYTESVDGNGISGKITTVEILNATEARIERSLKLADVRVDSGNPYKQQYGRGTENIAQINAYSVWYDANGTVPASLVDKDSNAGNIGVQNISTGISPKQPGYADNEEASADNINFYEDTVYKTGIEIAAEGTENTKKEVNDRYGTIFGEAEDQILREIKGKVWDDSRSHILTAEANPATAKDKQYVGNGLYTDAEDGTKRDVKHEEAKHNESLPLFYKVDTNGDGKYDTEDNDLLVKDAKAEYIEIVKVPVGSEVRYYEQILMGVTWNQAQNKRTDSKGEYHLKGMKPGNYIVRFTYGDTIKEENYNVADANNIPEEQKHMLIFNGQDYKSTVYNPHLEDTQLDNDEVLRRLEAEDLSDARDDEIRRLKTNAYSEVMTNNIAEILKGLANSDKGEKDALGNVTRKSLTPNSDPNTVKELKALTDNTYMNAETREFLVKAEKLTTSQTAIYTETKTPAASEINAIDNSKTVQLKEMLYKNLNYLKNTMVDNRDFVIENVDLGIEYRPESEISLIKEISEIKLITEDKTTLVDLHFKSESDGKYRKHSIDSEKSKGLELVQFITNDYTTKPLINNLTSEESLQGLVYIQVDQEILQGCTVQITYSFEAQNNSEVDRISTNLDEIRYKANPKTTELITEFRNQGFEILPKVVNEKGETEEKYTASGIAANIIDAETYRDEAQKIGDKEKGVTEENVTIRYRIKEKLMTTKAGNGDNEYFGKYNGYSYYTGKLEKGADGKDLDTIATLKFDKILDYVDTGLKYEPDATQQNIKDKLWATVTTDELIDYVYQLLPYRPKTEGTTIPALTNVDGAKYESLVVSVDDRTKDDKYSSDKPEFSSVDNSTIRNNDLSRFLLPKVLETGYLPNKAEEYDNYIDKVNALTEEQKRTFTGRVSLEVSKVLAAGTDDDDMTYENMAEIVQFTTLTGRRTNFATTIGNADMHRTKAENPTANPGSTEFMTASLEPDTSATETVTLIPPTGLMKNRRAIVSLMETAKTSVEVVSITGLVVAIIAVVVVAILFVIRKYKKRRIV